MTYTSASRFQTRVLAGSLSQSVSRNDQTPNTSQSFQANHFRGLITLVDASKPELAQGPAEYPRENDVQRARETLAALDEDLVEICKNLKLPEMGNTDRRQKCAAFNGMSR